MTAGGGAAGPARATRDDVPVGDVPSGAVARRWLAAGLAAGAVVGAGDTLWTVVRGVGGLDVARSAVLVLLGASWVGLAGLAAGALGALLAVVAVRAAPARRSRRAALLVAAVASPVVVIDAFALFAGRRAAEISGHRALSVALAAAGVAAVLAAAWLGAAVLAGGAAPTRSRRAARIGFCGALAALALAAEIGNGLVLPRLYPWFHATLALLTLAAAVGAARFWLAARAPSAVPAGRVLVRAAVVLVVVAVAAGFEARRSQSVRFAALERTAAMAEVVRLSPVSLRFQTLVAIERDKTEVRLPPLPEGPRRSDADVVLITVDALRADHVGAWGYKRRPTTPHIDALAATAARFSRAYAQAPHTSFSVASMLTGKYFPTLARLAPAEVHDPIASVLKQYRWRTAAFYPPAVFFVDAQKLKAYADSNFGFEYVKFEYMEAQKRVDQVIRYYDVEKPSRAFVWVHFFEPHEPYDAHAEFPFGGADIDRYDGEIAYADAAIGRLLDYLRAHRPNTIVIVAADHGEEFDEHGGRYHGSSLFEEQIHVPLLVAVPGVAPRVVDRPVELIDIAPTVLNLLDLPVPARMRGTDLGPWLATPPADAARLPPAFAEVEDKRMVVLGNEKLICDLNWGFCAYHDLAVDPGERRNLADARPDRAAALHAVLDDWLDGHVRFEPVLARGASNPNGEAVPRAIERGRLGDLLAGPALAALIASRDEPVRVRREAAQLLATLPPRKETADDVARAVGDADSLVADWAAVGAVRTGDARAIERARAIVGDAARPRILRVRGGLALGVRGDATGVPVLAESLAEMPDDVLLCRLIILQLGKLRDRRAVPALLAHLPAVQNRREMVDALGDIGDPAAIPALIERLGHDEYVPVRAQAARALAKIGRVDVREALDRAAHNDTEATVSAAAREALEALDAGRPG